MHEAFIIFPFVKYLFYLLCVLLFILKYRFTQEQTVIQQWFEWIATIPDVKLHQKI